MSVRKFDVGASVLLRNEQGLYVTHGVVRERSPRRIIVWTGTTGFGQKRWPFDDKGRPVGKTAVCFSHLRLDLTYVDPFKASSSDIKHYRSA